MVFICPDHNEKYKERRAHMESMLQRIGCTHIIHYKSNTENYPACLNEAIVTILESYMDTPVMIVEDDVEFTGMDTFDFIQEADAIYFGLSRSAGHPTENKDEGFVQILPYSDTQVRVLNMLGGHAILYISPTYKRSVIELLTKHKATQYHTDVLFSRLQPQFCILANKKPAFYQAAKFNKGMHEETWTKIEFH